MSIADALTRGDISAAAQAVQDARAENAQSALTGQRDTLTRVRDESIAALGRVEIEKTNKVLQLEIATIEKNQLTTLESQKTTIENTIAGHNANLKALNTQVDQLKNSYIYGNLTKLEIQSLEGLITKAKDAGILFTDEVNTAPPSVQAALLRVCLDKVAGDCHLGDDTSVIAAANPNIGSIIDVKFPILTANSGRIATIEPIPSITDLIPSPIIITPAPNIANAPANPNNNKIPIPATGAVAPNAINAAPIIPKPVAAIGAVKPNANIPNAPGIINVNANADAANAAEPKNVPLIAFAELITGY